MGHAQVGNLHLYSGEVDGGIVIIRDSRLPEITLEEVVALLRKAGAQ